MSYNKVRIYLELVEEAGATRAKDASVIHIKLEKPLPLTGPINNEVVSTAVEAAVRALEASEPPRVEKIERPR